MYNEERQGFSVRDILIQLLFIILFIFILVWLFPTKSSMDKQYGALNDKLNILTGTIYNSNLQTMKDAAINYYTNERLPQAINDVERMTLKEMIDKKLLVEFVDGNGNKCSTTSSYVEVIKLEDEYQMKVSLSCTDNDAYIIVYLGCYDYCSATGVCEKKETPTVTTKPTPTPTPNPTPTPTPTVACSYEYEKVTDGKWGEYGSWSSWSTNLVSNTDYRRVEVKTEKVLSGTQQVQTGSKVETINASGTTTKYCPSGYVLNGDKCTRTATGYYMAKCPKDFTLNSNGTCSGSLGTTTTFSPSCPSGYTRSGTTCYKVNSSTATATPTCPSGYKLSGSTCVSEATGPVTYSKGTYITTLTGYSVPANNSSYYYETVSSDYVYKCVGDNPCAFVWVYTYKKYTSIVSGGETSKTTPSCPSGYSLSGSSCVKPTTSTESTPATCSSGTLVGELCYVYGTQDSTVSATCPTGFTLTGNKCYGTKTTTTAVSTTTSYSCPSGYSLSGSTCTRSVPVYETQNVYKDVKYYRYKERTYISGSRVTEWSKSQNDTYLISKGYTLTGSKKCS